MPACPASQSSRSPGSSASSSSRPTVQIRHRSWPSRRILARARPMSVLGIDTASVFSPLLAPARYKGAFGGRGSGKSHFFAGLMIEDALAERGLRSVCIREVQRSLKDSAKRLLEDKLAVYRLGEADGFRVFREVIETPGDGLITFQGMQDHTADSIKALEGFKRAWVEEA